MRDRGASENTRLLYLERMGIQAWVPRVAEAAVEPPPVASLEARQEEVARCARCGRRADAAPLSFATGPADASLLIISAAAESAGDALRLLDNMLRAIGVDRATALVTAPIECPPGAAALQPGELHTCAGRLAQQIQSLAPAAVLALGEEAARALFGSDASLESLRGVVRRLEGVASGVVVSFAPEELLRAPDKKALAWQDLKQLTSLL